MPEMRKERATAAVNVDLDNVQVNVAQPTAGVVKERRWETTQANLTLPAGAYSVHVRHADPSGGVVTINGDEIRYNRFYEREVRTDDVNNKQDFTPEVIISNPEGKKIAVSVSYPSSSAVNPQAL